MINNNLTIPEKLKRNLLPQEEVEVLEKPQKEAYDKQKVYYIKLNLILSALISSPVLFISLVMFVGIFFVFVLILTPHSFWKVYQLSKNYPTSFYGFTNMRLIYADPVSPKIQYFYFKDIHELSIKNGKIIIDINEYTRHEATVSKQLFYLIGVNNPEKFINVLNEKLVPFRLGKSA